MFGAPRLVNRSTNKKSKQAIAREADHDLRELEFRRRQAGRLNDNPAPQRPSKTINRKAQSSSDDSDVEVEPRAKVPCVISNEPARQENEDDIVVVGEFVCPGAAPQLQLNLASNRVEHNEGTGNTIDSDIFEDRVPSPSSALNLVGFLNSEIRIERQSHMNLSAQNEPTIRGFEIFVKDQAEIKLVRKIKNEHVQVLFNINNSLCLPSDEASSAVSLPSLTVEILKDDSRLAFVVGLEKKEHFFDIRIETFYHLPIGRNEPNPVASKNDPGIYQALLRNCPAQLNDIFCDFLRDRGITCEFIKELIDYATCTEHAKYLDLLSKTKKFIESL